MQVTSQLESEDQTKKLMEALKNVRPASIARWNEHKDVKEDKERDPCFFSPMTMISELDPGSDAQAGQSSGMLEQQMTLFAETK